MRKPKCSKQKKTKKHYRQKQVPSFTAPSVPRISQSFKEIHKEGLARAEIQARGEETWHVVNLALHAAFFDLSVFDIDEIRKQFLYLRDGK
jgi:hypothetical protein